MRKRLYSLATLGVSLVILAVLYRNFDVTACRELLGRISIQPLVTIVVCLLAIDLLMALRWQAMTRVWYRISYAESLMLVLASSALNVVVPSKLGGLAKAYFLNRRAVVPGKEAIALVIYERLLDLATMSMVFLVVVALVRSGSTLVSLSLTVAAGIVLLFVALHLFNVPRALPMRRVRDLRCVGAVLGWLDVFYVFHTSPDVSKKRLATIHLLSLLLWLCHAVQIVAIFRVIVPGVATLAILRNMFCAIFVGFLPISAAGVGTRDFAIVHLFKGLASYQEALLVGAATTLVRYVIPTLIGVPFLLACGSWRFVEARGEKTRTQKQKRTGAI